MKSIAKWGTLLLFLAVTGGCTHSTTVMSKEVRLRTVHDYQVCDWDLENGGWGRSQSYSPFIIILETEILLCVKRRTGNMPDRALFVSVPKHIASFHVMAVPDPVVRFVFSDIPSSKVEWVTKLHDEIFDDPSVVYIIMSETDMSRMRGWW